MSDPDVLDQAETYAEDHEHYRRFWRDVIARDRDHWWDEDEVWGSPEPEEAVRYVDTPCLFCGALLAVVEDSTTDPICRSCLNAWDEP